MVRAASLEVIMHIDHLTTFLAIAEHGSFSESARALGLGQSTITARIQRLEHDMSVQLFDRSKTPIELTGAGRVFIRYAQQMLLLMLEGREAMVRIGMTPEQSVSITAAPTAAAAGLPELLAGMGRTEIGGDLPNVSLAIATSHRTFRNVRDGLVDIGITSRHFAHPDITTDIVLDQKLDLVIRAGKADEAAYGGIEGALPLYFLEDGQEDSIRIEALCKQLGIMFGNVLGVRDTGILVSLARSGLGWAMAPHHVVAADLRTRALEAHPEVPSTRLPRMTTCVLTRRGTAEHALTPAIGYIVAALNTHFRALALRAEA